jgi:cation diffusion facilitator CzcD-associated flavoprotein CzcO
VILTKDVAVGRHKRVKMSIINLSSNFDADAIQALKQAGPDPQNWVHDRPGIDHNVFIVGGGQSGTALAFALRRAGIGKITVVDSAETAAQAGIWLTRARMNVLRTPKNLVGPELGLQALSFQTWYTARHGAEAYNAFDRIPRTAWAEYLDWYRQFLKIEVRYGTEVVRIVPADGHFRLYLSVAGENRVETARKVILANGFAGSGGVYIPPVLKDSLPAQAYAHTGQEIDFTRLRGKVVAVIGAAASAFDAAATALEADAAEVHLFARRDRIAATPVGRVRGYAGAYDNYAQLPDAVRWRQSFRHFQSGSTPPVDSIDRVTKFPNFFLHLGAPWISAKFENGRIAARAGGDDFICDFAVAATGYLIEIAECGLLEGFAHEILRWRDRFTPPADEHNPTLGAYPYFGEGHEFLEKVEGRAPYLRDIHVVNLSGFLSFGGPVGDVPTMRRGIPAVVSRISRDLLLADLPEHERRLSAVVEPEFSEQLYSAAVRDTATVPA